MKSYRLIILLLSVGISGLNILAQDTMLLTDSLTSGFFPDTSAAQAEFDFFGSDESLEMTLCFNFSDLIKTRNEPENIDANLSVKLNDTLTLSQQIKIKARGEMRRKIGILPPIMLKFKNGDPGSQPIRKKGNLKLVTPCKYSTMYKNYVLKEYLAYRLFNLVTPYSFKTRLVKITYINAKRPKNTLTAFGFLIENEKDFAARHDAVIVGKPISHIKVEAVDMARVSVFNYLIGNTDWYLSCRHNIKLIKPNHALSDKVIPVAFDFDYSGFVDTDYSIPSSVLPIDNVRERYYNALCSKEEEIKPVIEEFMELKDQFIGTIEQFDHLSIGDRKQAVNYLNSFYKENKSTNVLISEFNRTCIQSK